MLKGGLVLIWELDMNLEPILLFILIRNKIVPYVTQCPEINLNKISNTIYKT